MPFCLNCGSNEFHRDVVTATPVNQAYQKTAYDLQHFFWSQVQSDICVKCGNINIHIHNPEAKELSED